MLTSETKQKINSLRQILVGKVPNPTDQVDQITNALIYKYMDDMDQQAISLGGKAGFFVGKKYEKYAWKNLMDTKIGAQDRMNMYTEALESMGANKNLSSIFQDILKGAFLPYRSPETLNLFLHEIDSFSYSHSEELGNAFEYLLSIMGSQGDAGMFRTPRHIIDFIVKVVNPTKDDTVLDPACGTAGFLISAYKHIKGEHDGLDNKTGKKTEKEKPLTSVEVKKIHKNFSGYDISPNMTKLSRANMFLHQFPDPQIYEYDTLSSEERWDEHFDVILANPPFMSPKGGIVPHSRFSIKANRSEVLFVDYILEHLKPKGRAGIIVPEGVIFQSGNAYKQLRKALVEDGLWAVVSLPQGVFNPYARVKTSILLFDNNVTKQSDEVLFVKIENDGFDLGAQRRPIDQNDLPKALEILSKWRDRQKFDKDETIAHKVKKSKIAENDDYNLSGDRYRAEIDYTNVKWDVVSLSELEKVEKIEFLRGQGLAKKDIIDSGKNKCIHYGEIYTLYDPLIGNIVSCTDFEGKIKSQRGDVLVPATTTADAMGIAVARSLNEDGVVIGGDINIIRTRNKFILSDYLALLISTPPLKITLSKFAKGANILHLSNTDLRKLKIPLPPIKEQQEIINTVRDKNKMIEDSKKQIEVFKEEADQNVKGVWGE